ncbi:hypothetical protein [Leptospira bandrabouensis]|uniref:hypothetical protein n=1 Tax=Leptospira bandrabouensis TaxID=2484903 RepID=UPI001EE8B884|nr:hypothetical protein [Leptospira bandrabouensis]MCG6146588.1 hypothetical protein [Leptospira bandrabouensis]MCG6161951.1 hypothetical protein [Leptospira bandrabouensis]MCG6166156.1 hypothetical protein [Leptospira bandrabouensis]
MKFKPKLIFFISIFTLALLFTKSPLGSCEPCNLISFQDAAGVYIFLKNEQSKFSMACIDNSNSTCVEFNSGSFSSDNSICKLYLPNSISASNCENTNGKCVVASLATTIYYYNSWSSENSIQDCKNYNGDYSKN